MLMAERIPTYIVYSPNKVVYHPKIYTFEGNAQYFIIVGSSNLTTSGLFQNVEASICVENIYEKDDTNGRELLSDIFDYYNSFLNGEATSCKELTEKVLLTLVNAKIVLPEKTTRVFTNEQLRKLTTTSLSDIKKLKDTFGEIKRRGLRKSTNKRVRAEVLEPTNSDIKYHTASIELAGESMWIETKRMTGGSRNILDLSAKGKLNGVKKPGSVEFFGIDKDNHAQTKDITLVYNGKAYKNNTILYATDNSNWRIQLKGETIGKEKLTDISKPRLGLPGGFMHKILVFERIGRADKYKLYILEESEYDTLVSQSSDWARGGNGTGRAYGFIKPLDE